MIDLWPDDIETNRVKSPVAILREQGSLLGKKTKNLVEGEVLEAPTFKESIFVYGFFLAAPALNNYQYRLLTISHDINLYPVRVDVEEGILSEISFDFLSERFDPDGQLISSYLEANTEDDFMNLLREIFNSKKARQVIGGLLSQSDIRQQLNS